LILGVYRCLPSIDNYITPIISQSNHIVSPLQSPQPTNTNKSIRSNDKSNGKARIEKLETERSVPFVFVYLNPLPTEIMTGNDLLYVLSPKQPCWAN
jgi:potassium large conductance calcium-activated channel subfamily M alpha protein 1